MVIFYEWKGQGLGNLDPARIVQKQKWLPEIRPLILYDSARIAPGLQVFKPPIDFFQ
jgi:hypothetical protein